MLKLIFIKKLIGNFISDKRCAAAGGLMEHALSPRCPLRHPPRFLAKLIFAIVHNRFAFGFKRYIQKRFVYFYLNNGTMSTIMCIYLN